MCIRDRPYPDVDAMNEAMIAAWNERVHGNDTVYKKFRRSESCYGIFSVSYTHLDVYKRQPMHPGSQGH